MNKFTKKEINEIVKVIKSGILSSRFGNVTRRFEKKFAKRFNVKYAIAMNSGTSTLHSAIISCGVKEGDEVIIPAIGVICVPAAVIHANCIPVFADVDKRTFNIDFLDIERKITKKTKVIITISMFGLSSEIDDIIKIAKKYKLKVIEDSAMSFLSYYKGKLVGTIADAGSFSFEQTKHLSTGDGGMFITDDEDLAIRARQVADHGFKFMSGYGRIKNNIADIFEHIGWNYRMTEVCAAIGITQLNKLDALVEDRINVAETYSKIIKNYDFLIHQFVPKYCKSSYYNYAVVFNGKEKYKKKFLETINNKINIASLWFRQVYLEPALKKYNFKVNCPVTDRVGSSIITFKTDFKTKEEKNLAYESLKKTLNRL